MRFTAECHWFRTGILSKPTTAPVSESNRNQKGLTTWMWYQIFLLMVSPTKKHAADLVSTRRSRDINEMVLEMKAT